VTVKGELQVTTSEFIHGIPAKKAAKLVRQGHAHFQAPEPQRAVLRDRSNRPPKTAVQAPPDHNPFYDD
jgi:hypothetical protein